MGTAGSQLQPLTQAAPKRKADGLRLEPEHGRKDKGPNAALMFEELEPWVKNFPRCTCEHDPATLSQTESHGRQESKHKGSSLGGSLGGVKMSGEESC